MKTMKMKFIKNGNCDIYINPSGYCEIIDNNEELAQSLKDELESNMTQWFLGYNWGTKYLQNDKTGIFDSKKFGKVEIQKEITRVISKRTEVKKINVEKIDINGRKCEISVGIISTFGDFDFKIEL